VVNLNATGITDNKVGQIIKGRRLERPRDGLRVLMVTVWVDDRAAHSKGCIDEALIKKSQLLIFRFGNIAAKVDEKDAVALERQHNNIKQTIKKGAYAIIGVGAISRNSTSNSWSSFGTGLYIASL